jgi:hypothetical protein
MLFVLQIQYLPPAARVLGLTNIYDNVMVAGGLAVAL